MIFILISSIFSKEQYNFLIQETNCIYNRSFSDTFYSNNVICLVNCTFKSIKTNTNGGALVISLQNSFVTQNFINNCLFTECNSKQGSAICINMDKKATTEIINSTFTKNSAEETSGAIFINSIISNDLKIKNCQIESNSAQKSGGFIYFTQMNYSFENCSFNGNKLSADYDDTNGGSIYCEQSNGLFFNCSFINNEVRSKFQCSYGGSISFSNSTGSFIECNFINNTSKSSVFDSKGGAISYKKSINFLSINETIKKCYFYNNTCESVLESCGGAISSIIKLHNSLILKANLTFSEVTFHSNSANSFRKNSYGGAFYHQYQQIDSINESFLSVATGYLFDNVTFSNNKVFSNFSYACGGAISNLPTTKFKQNPFFYFINNNFINNTAYSSSLIDSSLLALGGAIHLNRTEGFIQNCSFNKNVAESFLGTSLIIDKEPQILGGAVYLLKSEHYIKDCIFTDNLVIGKAPKYFSLGKGGALYSSYSKISIFSSDFINNSLFHYGNKFDVNHTIEGGAVHSRKTVTSIYDCNFINNKITIQALKKTNNFFAKAQGGAVYSDNYNYFVNCCNCIFKDNLVHIPNYEENEFGGALFLVIGNISNCTFDNNFAFNGGDISIYQLDLLSFRVNKCRFNHKNNSQINSLIFIYIDENSLMYFFYFTNNEVVILNNSTYVFDAEIIWGINRKHNTIKWKFGNNCIYPYNKELYKPNNLNFIAMSELIKFEEFFDSSCNPDPIITQTQKVPNMTSTQEIITQTQNIPDITFTQTKLLVNKNENNSNDLEYHLYKIKSIVNLLTVILVIQAIIIILILIGIIHFNRIQITNQNDLDPLVADR